MYIYYAKKVLLRFSKEIVMSFKKPLLRYYMYLTNLDRGFKSRADLI